jgi:hypothetical protein
LDARRGRQSVRSPKSPYNRPCVAIKGQMQNFTPRQARIMLRFAWARRHG